MSLHYVEKGKRLQVASPAQLVVRNAILESLHSRLIILLGLLICLQMVGCGDVVFGAQFSAYRVEDLGDHLLSTVD